MMGLDPSHPWVFTFAVLGNAISFLVFLSPIRTFIGIFKKKSTEGFSSVPYVVSIFSALLWIFYAILKPSDSLVILVINTIGLFIMILYLITFIIFADYKSRISSTMQFLALNVCGFGLIILIILLAFHDTKTRVNVLGWICVSFSVAVFAAPLSIITRVVKTKSVEFMPFLLTLFLTLSAVTWFFYGLLIKDYYVAAPNVLGFLLGMTQMVVYIWFRKSTKMPTIIVDVPSCDEKGSDIVVDIVNFGTPSVEPTSVVEVIVVHDSSSHTDHPTNEPVHEEIITVPAPTMA